MLIPLSESPGKVREKSGNLMRPGAWPPCKGCQWGTRRNLEWLEK